MRERRYWDDYMHAYEEAIAGDGVEETRRGPSSPRTTSRWFTRLVVAASIVEAVEELDLKYPKVTAEQKKDLAGARAELEAEK